MMLRFLQDRMRKESKSYMEFYKDYGFFLKEGIVTCTDQHEKEEIAKLLRFECSSLPAGETMSIPEYCGNMKAGHREILYLSAPSRQLAENSPYYENLKKTGTEVLFCYEPYDELVLMQLQQFDKKTVVSVEKEMRAGPAEEAVVTEETLELKEQTELTDWVKVTLGPNAARHFIKTQAANFSEEQRFTILQPQFEINPAHPIVKKLNSLRETNAPLAILVTEQLFANAMVSAGLVFLQRLFQQVVHRLEHRARV